MAVFVKVAPALMAVLVPDVMVPLPSPMPPARSRSIVADASAPTEVAVAVLVPPVWPVIAAEVPVVRVRMLVPS